MSVKNKPQQMRSCLRSVIPFILIALIPLANAQRPAVDAPATGVSSHKALTTQYCFGCHNKKTKTARPCFRRPRLCKCWRGCGRMGESAP